MKIKCRTQPDTVASSVTMYRLMLTSRARVFILITYYLVTYWRLLRLMAQKVESAYHSPPITLVDSVIARIPVA